MIYTLNNDFINIVKEACDLDPYKVYSCIQDEFILCKDILKKKGINYNDLKKALIPNKDLEYKEIAFWFDTMKISNGNYGHEIMSKIIPAFDKNSTFSILLGDYINVLNSTDSQFILQTILNERLTEVHKTKYIDSSQFFVVYINRLSNSQFNAIVESLKKNDWFYGYTDLFDSSVLKSYLSTILVNDCVKCKNNIIVSNPDGFTDEDNNVNLRGYPFEDNGFKVISVNDEKYDTFLCYKIETVLLQPDDCAFSINAIYPRFEYMKNLDFEIPIDKWKYLNRESTEKEAGKGQIMKILSPELQELDSFKEYIFKNLCNNYIYSLDKNEFGVYKFCECIGLKTKNGHYRKTLISLKYIPEESKLSLITIT